MSPIDEPRLSPWEEEGRRHGAALDACHFVVIAGDDPAAAAELALGLARVQARRRRAAVADAVGELPCIEDLAPMDAPHGIVDVCLHGVSLAQVAHRVDAAGSLEVLPSGSVPFDRTAVLQSPRWQRLAAEFRDTGSILLVVVPTDEPAVDAILPLTDGVVLAGRAQPWPASRVLLYVRAPGSGTYGALLGPPTPVFTRRVAPLPQRAAPAARLTTARPALPPEPSSWPRWITVAVTLLIATAVFWRGNAASPNIPSAAPTDSAALTAPDSTAAADSAADSAAVDTLGAPSSAPEAVAQRAAAAAADSNRRAAAWSVELAVLTSATSANARLDDDALRSLPATTWAPVSDSSGDRTWRLYAGAAADRAVADSLLTGLRARGVLPPGAGRVVRLPFAVVVQSGATRDEASFLVMGLRSKGLPVYPLVEEDGSMRMYAGAFERAADAALLVATLRANGETPSVTYRIGRTP